MKNLVKKHAAGTEEGNRRLAAAVERVAALPAGAAMLEVLAAHRYGIYAAPQEGPGGLIAEHKALVFDQGLAVDEMVLFLPHEVFHGVQMVNCPDLLGFYRGLVAGKEADGVGPAWPRPRDFLWAMNVMEMTAYAVQVDFAFRLADELGDGGARDLVCEYMPSLAGAYESVMQSAALYTLAAGPHVIFKADRPEALEMDFRRDYAAAAVAHLWFWAAADARGGGAASLHYNDEIIAAVRENCVTRAAPVFNAAAEGKNAPSFRAWGREDILRLGRGYAVNPLDVPGFSDVAGMAYRNRVTRENDRVLRLVERRFGL